MKKVLKKVLMVPLVAGFLAVGCGGGVTDEDQETLDWASALWFQDARAVSPNNRVVMGVHLEEDLTLWMSYDISGDSGQSWCRFHNAITWERTDNEEHKEYFSTSTVLAPGGCGKDAGQSAITLLRYVDEKTYRYRIYESGLDLDDPATPLTFAHKCDEDPYGDPGACLPGYGGPFADGFPTNPGVSTPLPE